MTKYFGALLVIVFASFAHAEGISCFENSGPFGGSGLRGFKLVPLGNDYFELTYVTATIDGSDAKTISVAQDLKCQFSKIDPIVLECNGDKEINPTMHYANYIQVTKNVATAISSLGDGVYTSYNLKIAAPEMSDEQLKTMAGFDPFDSNNPNLSNRSFKTSFSVATTGLSGCKTLK